jgi:hypothetical protein
MQMTEEQGLPWKRGEHGVLANGLASAYGVVRRMPCRDANFD